MSVREIDQSPAIVAGKYSRNGWTLLNFAVLGGAGGTNGLSWFCTLFWNTVLQKEKALVKTDSRRSWLLRWMEN